MSHLFPVLIDRPGVDCSRPANERLCVAVSGCSHALTTRLGPRDYHYTRCGRDGGAEAFVPAQQPIPEPPASGPRRVAETHLIADTGRVFLARRRGDCSMLADCEDGWLELHGDEQAKCPAGCVFYGCDVDAPRSYVDSTKSTEEAAGSGLGPARVRHVANRGDR